MKLNKKKLMIKYQRYIEEKEKELMLSKNYFCLMIKYQRYIDVDEK